VQDRTALDERVEHFAHADAGIEQVFARLHVARLAGNRRADDEHHRDVDDALAAQEFRYVADARAARNEDGALAVERSGGLELVLAEIEPRARRDDREHDDGQDRVADDDDGMARTARGRRRQALGRDRLARAARMMPAAMMAVRVVVPVIVPGHSVPADVPRTMPRPRASTFPRAPKPISPILLENMAKPAQRLLRRNPPEHKRCI